MAFRRNEVVQAGFERAKNYLIPKELPLREQNDLADFIDDLTIRLGPVVDYYPTWHPLVCNNKKGWRTRPNEECGYRGLDHNLYFLNGFISCPYQNGQDIIDSVNRLWNDNDVHKRYSHLATIEAERIDMPLYSANPSTEPVLVECKWFRAMPMDRTIPKNVAIGLMLEEQVPYWRTSEVGETWENMRPYLMGEPYGKRSSIFLEQEAGLAMKKVYEAMVYSGMYGNLAV